ncbi:hypothetical protein Poli38472_003805 [Pythium oligandrum]|uniref:aminodeoxychorismate synthase n=1 Tax=Pythium oligandrum TaxID=41045 RepID=A0A8K1CMI6_PYTOL|nr:hypothetical protein Poli38472_003805 [Pythium oligandrum]|eukprot:TMW66040.1 hypothetical protein Poli38472_003805 [Pythium oligandrum]
MKTLAMPRVLSLLIDNYDSYTYNIFQMLAEINGLAPVVIKNDDFQGHWPSAWAAFLRQATKIAQEHALNDPVEARIAYNVVISPGPGHPAVPADFGMCADAIRSSTVPVLGVCLGHQGLATVYGGDVVNAPEVMHGRTSAVRFDSGVESKLFAHVPDGFEVVRYHSLTVSTKNLPPELQVTACTDDGVVMAMQHRTKPQYGVQFHPEAVCSTFGYQLFQNFRDITLNDPPTKCLLQHSDRAVSTSGVVPLDATTEGDSEFKVVIDRVATGLASLDFAQFVFDELFREAPRSFWLDSSNYSPSPTVTGQTSRFSYMGDDSGPLSYCVEYSVLDNELRLDGVAQESSEHRDMRGHLRAQLQRFQSHCVVDHRTNEQLGDDVFPFNFRGGFVGYFGYELLENGLEDPEDASASVLREAMKQKKAKGDYVPDASFIFADRTLVFDHVDECVYTMSISSSVHQASSQEWHTTMATRLTEVRDRFTAGTGISTPAPVHTQVNVVFHPSRPRSQYISDIHEVLRQIHDGETYEVCLTNQLRAEVAIQDPLALYHLLRRRNPAPYAAFYRSNPGCVSSSASPSGMTRSYAVCSSSPERFLSISRDGWMESKPIKGTRRRGHDAAEDDAIRDELATCMKDRAENMMIADLVRNDFGRVAQIGSVHVPKLMSVESYATVHQLVTTVRALRSPEADVVDVLEATFPGGSMTGAPKKRTMQLIRQLERHPRGVYSGALGFLSVDGSCDLNIIIRTAVITESSVTLGSGGAIVALSDQDEEYDEMLLKTRALVAAVGAFVTGDDTKARVVTNE